MQNCPTVPIDEDSLIDKAFGREDVLYRLWVDTLSVGWRDLRLDR